MEGILVTSLVFSYILYSLYIMQTFITIVK